MHPAFQTLLVLQDRDQTLDSLRKDLEDLPRLKERELARLADDEATVTRVQETLRDNHKACDRLELDIKTRKDSIERLETQRYETRKNEEYTALGHEIENYQTQVSALEDQELALWEEAEALQAQLAAAEDTLANHRRGIEVDLAKLDERVEHIGARHREVEAEREVLAAELDDSLRQRYDLLRRRKPDPCAEVRRGACNGCHMKVPRGVDIEAARSDQLVECPNCGRFLYAIE